VRRRFETADGDFLDLDFWLEPGEQHLSPTGYGNEYVTSAKQARPLAIIAHGMEGSSDAHYIRGMARALHQAGYDICAWNMRGCGGEPNRLPSFYHSGKTDDLAAIINCLAPHYTEIVLVGFSLGGNVTLKYLGECGSQIDSRIRAAMAISAPCDLAACAEVLRRRSNFIYLKRFLLSFWKKIRQKMALMPERLNDIGYSSIRDFRDFDNRYTAPDFGYPNADAYWKANSSTQFLMDIAVPTLLLSSQDDPFLSPECFPKIVAQSHDLFTFELAAFGGHCGFMRDFKK